MASGRRNHASAVLPDGSVLVAGGLGKGALWYDYEAGRPLRSSEVFRSPGGWSEAGELPHEFHQGSMFALADGRVVALGGPNAQATALWDPESRRWHAGPSLSAPVWVGYAAAPQRDGAIILAYGERMESWDGRSPSWVRKPAPQWSVSAAALAALPDGRVLLVGEGGPGRNSYAYEPSTRFQLWDPSTEHWQEVGAWPGSGFRHLAARLAGGPVLVLRQGNDSRLGAILWNPTDESLEETVPPDGLTFPESLVALADGRALILGQLGAAVWQPTMRKWAAVPTPGIPLSRLAVTLLQDGRVLATGGDGPPVRRLVRWSAVASALALLGVASLAIGAALAIRKWRPAHVLLACSAAIAAASAGMAGWLLWLFAHIMRMD
ncbi:MAG: hypothetical protein HYZ28_01870 [Myxococcales bacterium]|nr:hypothetical protein [Myxococcales bacterium]